MNSNLFLKPSTQPTPRSRWEIPLTGALLTLAITLLASMAPAHSSSDQPTPEFQPDASVSASEAATSTEATEFSALTDGVYLYGESAEPEQIGSAYMVFEVSDRQVVGAFFMPQSSFDCFHGEVKADELALTIRNSYDQASYPYAVALNVESNVATTGNPILTAQLEGFQPIATISDTNHQLIETCRVSF